MYKTLIQLVLLLILILIIFFIYNKYFYTEDIVDEVKNPPTISKEIAEINELSNKNLIKKNTDNEILDLTYEKFDTNGNKYFINAKKGTIDSKNPNIIYMNEVEASLLYLNDEKLIVYSDKAIFNKENFKTTFSKNVKLLYQEHTLESDHLDFLIDKNIAIFRDNVRYENLDTNMFSDEILINLLTKEVTISSKKKVKIEKN